jgi:ATP-dependent DNA helicase PIF1
MSIPMQKEKIIKLNNMQQKAYDLVVKDKQNIFLTGPGGVGKSFLIKKIKSDLETKYFKTTAITSTTGISAQIIGGSTLFSYLGIQMGTKSFDVLLVMLKKNIFTLNRWRRLNVLIIDEVSMMSIELFEKLEKLARALRGNEKPFGGIQLVLTGDFCQLPSVKQSGFLFESDIWETCINHTIYLTQVIRQTDELFIRVLNKVRLCEIDQEVQDVLKSREIKYISDSGIIPTMIYATNAKVDNANLAYYNKLTTPEHVFNLKYNWHRHTAYKEKYDNLIRFKQELRLKIGSQVMYLINKNNLVNGSRGIIKDFVEGFPVVLFDNGTELTVSHETLDIEENNNIVLSYTQLPLTLAWAITIHKSQGSTLTLARVNCKHIFEFGQLYVGISRIQTLEGLYLRNLDFDVIKANPKAIAYYKKII